jgi:uncharacterized protein
VRFAGSVAAVLSALWLGVCTPAQGQVPVPPLTARVTDLTHTLSAEQVASLEQTLQAFETRKGTQIAVLMLPSTQPESIEQYSIRVVEQWRLGRQRVDDGALLIIAKDDRAMRIEVGYGLEGALNDAVCARIIREIITPRFRQADFYGGISDGLARMIGVVDGEPLPAPAAHSEGPQGGQYLTVMVVLAVVLSAFASAALGRLPGALVSGGVIGILFWFVAHLLVASAAIAIVTFLFTLIRGSTAGRVVGGAGWMGGFGGGLSGGFGSGGGGGFSGGGGGFGGGGASGGW